MNIVKSSKDKKILYEYKSIIEEELKKNNSSNSFDYEQNNEAIINYIFDCINEYIDVYCNLTKNEEIYNSIIKEKRSDFLPSNMKILTYGNEEIELINCYNFIIDKLNNVDLNTILLDKGEILNLLDRNHSALYLMPNKIKKNLDSKIEILEKINKIFLKKNDNYLLKIFNDIKNKTNNKSRFDWVTINHNHWDIKVVFSYKKHIEIVKGNIEKSGYEQKFENVQWITTNFEIPYNLDSMDSQETESSYNVALINKRNESTTIQIEKNSNTYNYLQRMYSGM